MAKEQKNPIAAWGRVLVVEWGRDLRGRLPALKIFTDDLDEGQRVKMRERFQRLADFGRIENREQFKQLGPKARGEGRSLWEFKIFKVRFFGDFRKRSDQDRGRTMKRERSEYESFEASSRENRRLQRQEKLIVEVTEAIAKVLNESNISQTELAHRLGTTKGYVSQLLNGGRNLTLRTLADVADALQCVVEVRLLDQIELQRWSGLAEGRSPGLSDSGLERGEAESRWVAKGS